MSNTEKTCPACAESIKVDALVCRYCGNKFDSKDVRKESESRKAASAKEAAAEKSRLIDDRIDTGIYLANGFRTSDPFITGPNLHRLTIDQAAEGVRQLRGVNFESDMFDEVREWCGVGGGDDDDVLASDCNNERIINRSKALGMNFVQLTDEETAYRKQMAEDRRIANSEQEDRIRVQAQKKKHDSARRRPFIIAIVAMMLVAVAAFAYFGRGGGRGATGLDQESASASSEGGGMSYETCKSLYQPDFESCVNSSDLESDWNRCKKSFFDNMERCTKK